MVVIDIPVQFKQYLFIFVYITGCKSSRVKTIFCPENVNGLVYICLCDTYNVVYGLGIGRNRGLELLIGGKEEQLVLDNRTTEGSAISVFIKIADPQIDTIGLVT
jgi:hypothetical protein